VTFRAMASDTGTGTAGSRELDLAWRPSVHLNRLASLAFLSLLVPVLVGRPALLALAAPPLCLLAAGLGDLPPRRLTVTTGVDTHRCLEDEPVTVTARVTLPVRVDQLDIELDPAGTIEIAEGQPRVSWTGTDAATAEWVVRPSRWGRRSFGPVRVTVRAAGRLLRAEVACPLAEAVVLPSPEAARRTPLPAELPPRLGEHVSRSAGEGVEFHGIRTFAYGDRSRRINWPASTRRGRLQVNMFEAERAVDVVLLIDALSDVGEPGHTSLDASVRGATALAQAYLRTADRVGVVTLGGFTRWLAPDVSARQFYRIAEAVLDVRLDNSEVPPDLARVPRSALLPGALLVLFSPLLHERALEVVRELRERGFALVVIDVLTAEPDPDPRLRSSALALRLWRLDRAALTWQLGQLGVPVLPWDGDGPLDDALAAVQRRVLLGRHA
jgi:uncharacterized protein (DUF58 family)